jgi:hypothetical protein
MARLIRPNKRFGGKKRKKKKKPQKENVRNEMSTEDFEKLQYIP